jgi:hypothetical protein
MDTTVVGRVLRGLAARGLTGGLFVGICLYLFGLEWSAESTSQGQADYASFRR